MNTLYLIFEGDAWLSTGSLVLMGLYENYSDAVDAVMEALADSLVFDDNHDPDDIRRYLEANAQTPTLQTNYIIKTATLNEWGEI